MFGPRLPETSLLASSRLPGTGLRRRKGKHTALDVSDKRAAWLSISETQQERYTSRMKKTQTEKQGADGIAVHCAYEKMVKVSGLKPNPRNYNKHPAQQIELLAKNIKAMGWRHPVIVSKLSGLIVAGHARLEAAKVLGVATVPVDFQAFASPEEETAYLIADNKIAELAEMDETALKELLAELTAADIDMDLTGFTGDALAEMTGAADGEADAEPQLDKSEELNKEWKVKTGDLWMIGEHRLLCGDSTKKDDVERVMDGEKASLVFTDPPYGVSIGSKNRMLNAHGGKGGNTGRNRNTNDILDDDIKPEELKKKLLPAFENIRSIVMADDCTVMVTAPQGGELCMMMMTMMMEAKLSVRHVLIWNKNNPTFSMGRLDYDYQHEPILLTWGKKHKKLMKGEHKTSVWSVNRPTQSKAHPTMKPIELPMNAMLNHTVAGDIAWDSYLGSGTTMVAAENLHRKCFGIEISPNYCAVILQRMKDAFHGIEIKKA